MGDEATNGAHPSIGEGAIIATIAMRLATVERTVTARDDRLGRVEKELGIDGDKPTRLAAMGREMVSIKRWIKVTLIAVAAAKILPPDLYRTLADLLGPLLGS